MNENKISGKAVIIGYNAETGNEIRIEADMDEIQEALAIKKNESEQWKDTGLIAQYADENKKLKELLRQAISDMESSGCGNNCAVCNSAEEEYELPFCEDGIFEWRYKAEAEKLLGEDGEQSGNT